MKRLILIISIITLVVTSRLLPHPPNFTALGAAAVFSGAMLRHRFLSVFVPLISLLITDTIIGFHSQMTAVYLCTCLSTLIGWRLNPNSHTIRFAGAGLISSFFFFGVTNFSVWLFDNMYPKTSEGLMMCYVAALPFLKHTVTSDLLFILLLVGIVRLFEKIWPAFKVSVTYRIPTQSIP